MGFIDVPKKSMVDFTWELKHRQSRKSIIDRQTIISPSLQGKLIPFQQYPTDIDS